MKTEEERFCETPATKPPDTHRTPRKGAVYVYGFRFPYLTDV